MYVRRDSIRNLLYSNVDYYHKQGDTKTSMAFYATIRAIDDGISSADVREERHGHWIDLEACDIHHVPVYMCSDCFKEVADNYIKNHKYCLHCGAKLNIKRLEKVK
jgi:DNA-directed RNA polymerase subunit RPC12/RpoP